MDERRDCVVPLRRLFRMAAVLCLSISLPFGVRGAVNDGFNDNVNRADPNFVTASLLVIGPGNEFFGCAGHSSLRLECPKFNLDYCFSCESEAISSNAFRFVMGNLKMGMFAIPTKEFISLYEGLGRKATQYPLNLPADVKQRLWKSMDEKVAAGTCLHYDYIKYCCVQTVLQPILEAIKPYEVQFPTWPEKYRLTRREILADNLAWCPWTRIFLHTIAGTEVDHQVSNPRTVILSPDLVELLRGMRVLGKPVLEGEGVVLQSYQAPKPRIWVTPVLVACVCVGLAFLTWFFPCKWIVWLFLVFQSIVGALLTHLLLISNLPATDWNWLIVPFNLLPLIFWKWRAKWALGFVLVLLAWEVFMLVSPHRLTDTAYLVLVPAYMLIYLRFSPRVVSIFSPKRTRL